MSLIKSIKSKILNKTINKVIISLILYSYKIINAKNPKWIMLSLFIMNNK